jgi:hypothetical protein
MKKTVVLVFVAVSWAVMALAQDSGAQAASSTTTQAAASAAGSSAVLANGTTINAELAKSIDSRKLKVGDQVAAKVRQDVRSDGRVVIRRGSRLVGHVTEVKSRAKGDAQTSLGIMFDHAVVKGGQDVPLHAVIQAIAPPERVAASDDMGMSSQSQATMGPEGAQPSSGPLNGAPRAVSNAPAAAANTVGNVGRAAGNTAGQVAGAAANTNVNAGTTGVVGLPGLQLDTQASTATSGSVITSSGKDVRLDSGTQLMLRVVTE